MSPRFTALALVALVVACANESTESSSLPARGDQSSAVAIVDGVPITVAEFEARINEQSPYLRPRYKSMAKKQELLKSLIRFEVLAKEAEKRGFHKDPEVIRSMKQAMVQKLMHEQFENASLGDDIAEEDLRAYYEEHRSEYNRPEEVRISVIVLDDSSKADEIAKLAKGAAGSTNKGFRELVAAHSTDEASAKRGGDLQYLSRDSKEVPQAVIEAAMATTKTGEVVGPIAADKRHYIIKQTGRKKSVEKPFEEVKRSIKNRIYRDRRARAQTEFLDKLRSAAEITIDESKLAEVKVPAAPSPSATSDAQQAGHQH